MDDVVGLCYIIDDIWYEYIWFSSKEENQLFETVSKEMFGTTLINPHLH